MNILAIIGQKGGTGKTTVATGLAVAATRAGVACAVIDLDPQANAAAWGDRRGPDRPVVVSCVPARLRATLDALRTGGAELVIIDTPGRLESAGIEAARAAQLVLVPARAQVFDLQTLAPVRDLLRLAGDPRAFVVLNDVHPSATSRAAASKEVMAAAASLAVAPVHLCRRAAYADAPAHGQAPQEYEPGGKAGQELDALYKFASAYVRMRAQGGCP